MAKRKVKKEPMKPPPKIKYEDTKRFEVIDRMMSGNKGVWIESL